MRRIDSQRAPRARMNASSARRCPCELRSSNPLQPLSVLDPFTSSPPTTLHRRSWLDRSFLSPSGAVGPRRLAAERRAAGAGLEVALLHAQRPLLAEDRGAGGGGGSAHVPRSSSKVRRPDGRRVDCTHYAWDTAAWREHARHVLHALGALVVSAPAAARADSAATPSPPGSAAETTTRGRRGGRRVSRAECEVGSP